MTGLQYFTQGFIDALYFTDTGIDTDISDPNIELAPEARLDIEADCRSWWRRFGCYAIREGTPAQAGHDFWLTRNGHGAGFWDGNWPVYGDMLTEGSKAYDSMDIYVGEDGLLYVV